MRVARLSLAFILCVVGAVLLVPAIIPGVIGGLCYSGMEGEGGVARAVNSFLVVVSYPLLALSFFFLIPVLPVMYAVEVLSEGTLPFPGGII